MGISTGYERCRLGIEINRRTEMITDDAAKLVVYSHFSKCITKRIAEAIPELPNEELENLPLAVLLNILFLLRGDWGSLGDFVSTQRGLRALVGEKLFWNAPHPEPSAGGLVN
jgi:hypothetical protein